MGRNLFKQKGDSTGGVAKRHGGRRLVGAVGGQFLSATVLPGGSGGPALGFLKLHPANSAGLVLARPGQHRRGMTSMVVRPFSGLPPRWQRLENLPHKDKLERWGSPVPARLGAADRRCGSASPLAGCACTGCRAACSWRLGKFVRYWLVAQTGVAGLNRSPFPSPWPRVLRRNTLKSTFDRPWLLP